MTEESTTTAVAEAPVKKARKPRSAKPKAAKKKVAKKGTKKAASKGTKTPRKRKEGLRKAQIRILGALAKSSRPMTRAEIGERAGVDVPMMNSYIGSSNPAVRANNDKKVCLSLLTLKYVAEALGEEGGATSYKITAPGKAALEAAKKAAKS